MKVNIISIFPNYFTSIYATSILNRAQVKGFVKYNIVDLRKFTTDKHLTTDDRPFGGGAGMVMKIEPIDNALKALGVKKNEENKKIILTSAKGDLWTQKKAKNYSYLSELTIICGHYEGVDQRVADYLVDEEIRIGNYILTGGEVAAVVISDTIVRLIDGVLGNEDSLVNESHSRKIKYSNPVYTHPRNYKGWHVPKVLLSGNHKKISQWRKDHEIKQ